MNPSDEKILGICPNCKESIIVGRYGPYCKGKCGMFIQRAFGKELDEEQVIALLNNEKILLKGIQSKKGTTYDAYLEPIGIREFSYEKDGETKKGKQFAFNMEFPETEVE